MRCLRLTLTLTLIGCAAFGQTTRAQAARLTLFTLDTTAMDTFTLDTTAWYTFKLHAQPYPTLPLD